MFYVLPLLADLLMGMLAFLGPVWAVSQSRGVQFTSALGIVSSVSYVLSNLVLSRHINPRNAHQLTRFGILGIGVVTVLGVFANDPRWMFPIMIGASLCAACFFTPYQVVMHSAKARPLGQTVALYNLSWMSGYVVGPVMGGALMRVSRRLVHLSALAVAWIGYQLTDLAVARERADGRDHATERFDGADSQVQKRGRDFYIWIGWASIFVHGYAIGTVFYVFPKMGHMRGFSGLQLGLAEGLCTIAMIAATGFALRFRHWLYRPRLTVLAGLCGATAVGIVALTHSYAANVGGLLLLGASGGINCYVSVYYANNHADRGRGISMNEAAVGSGSVLGPAVGALLGGGDNPALAPYWIAMGIYLALGAGSCFVAKLRFAK